MTKEIVWHPDILNAKLTYNRVNLLYKYIQESKSLSIHPYKRNKVNVIKITTAHPPKKFALAISIPEELYITSFVNKLKEECGLEKIVMNMSPHHNVIFIENFTEEDAEKAALILRMKGV